MKSWYFNFTKSTTTRFQILKYSSLKWKTGKFCKDALLYITVKYIIIIFINYSLLMYHDFFQKTTKFVNWKVHNVDFQSLEKPL